MDIAQFSGLAALLIGRSGLFAFMFQQLETRLDRRIDGVGTELKDLRRDLAEEFRAQRNEIAAQTAAVASAINAARRP